MAMAAQSGSIGGIGPLSGSTAWHVDPDKFLVPHRDIESQSAFLCLASPTSPHTNDPFLDRASASMKITAASRALMRRYAHSFESLELHKETKSCSSKTAYKKGPRHL